MSQDFSLLPVIIAALVSFAILFGIIRLGVRYGMRDHQEWLDERQAAVVAEASKRLKGDPE